MNKKEAKQLALGMAALCVRNTYLESLHAGTAPASKAEDYSDVRVVSPYGEIPWDKLSRLNDGEMKKLMKEVVNKIYSVLIRLDDPLVIGQLIHYGKRYAYNWDEPEDLENLFKSK